MPLNLIILEAKLEGTTANALSRFAARARKAVRLKGDVNVLVTTSAQMRELNRRFRRKNKATDVLSFPAILEGFAGDIAISAEIAKANGRELGHGTTIELKILILHGMLHLAGYDHEEDKGEMERKERRLRSALGLPEGLIERNSPARGSARQRVTLKRKTTVTAARKTTRIRRLKR